MHFLKTENVSIEGEATKKADLAGTFRRFAMQQGTTVPRQQLKRRAMREMAVIGNGRVSGVGGRWLLFTGIVGRGGGIRGRRRGIGIEFKGDVFQRVVRRVITKERRGIIAATIYDIFAGNFL